MAETTTIDIKKIALRAREIAFANSKQGEATIGDLNAWIGVTVTHLAIREALSENMPLSEIFREMMRTKEEPKPKENAAAGD